MCSPLARIAWPRSLSTQLLSLHELVNMLKRRIVVGYVAGLLTACVVMNSLTPESLSEGILERKISKISQLSDTVKSTTKAQRESALDALIDQRNDVKSVDKLPPRRKFSYEVTIIILLPLVHLLSPMRHNKNMICVCISFDFFLHYSRWNPIGSYVSITKFKIIKVKY